MSSKMFNDSLEENNFSSRSTENKTEDNQVLTIRSDLTLDSKGSSDYHAGGCGELVPFYGGNVPRSCVRHIQQISKQERNKRMKKSLIFPPVPGHTDTTSPAVRKEMDARYLVGRWLHQPTTVEARNKNGIQRVNKFTLSSSIDVNEIENRMRNLNFELNKSTCEHSVKCLNSTHSETRTCDSSNMCRSWLASHSSSSLDTRIQHYQRMKLRNRVVNSLARHKTTSYLEQFYQKRYGSSPIQDIPRECSLCPTLDDDSPAQSVSPLSSTDRSAVSVNSEAEEEFYRKLIENEKETQRLDKELQAVNSGGIARKIQSKSEQTLGVSKSSLCPSVGTSKAKDCKSVLEAMKPEIMQSIKKKHLVVANGALKYTTYKPYNIKDYRNLPPPKLGSLGPDLEASKEKFERMKKQRAYGDCASIRNRQRYMEKEQLRTSRMLLPGIRVPPLALNGTPPFQPRLDITPTATTINAPSACQPSTKPKAEVRPRKKLNPSTYKLGAESSGVAPRACLLTTLQERHQKEVEIANTIRREIV